MSYKFDDTKSYSMPTHCGTADKNGQLKLDKGRYDYYHDTTITFETDYDAVAALLPPGFEPMEVATINVGHSMARGCDYMGGHGYNLIRVNAAARFNGKRDKAEGNFSLVMWENEFIPIMMGREVLGVGKLLAEIPDLSHRGDTFGFYAAEYGNRLVEGKVSNMKEVPIPAPASAPQPDYFSGWMSWKYIPNMDFKGAEVSHATALPAAPVVKRRWEGEGIIKFNELSFAEAPLSGQITTVLSKLPIKRYLGAVQWEGSTDLLISEQFILK